jgi:hypothetical protein
MLGYAYDIDLKSFGRLVVGLKVSHAMQTEVEIFRIRKIWRNLAVTSLGIFCPLWEPTHAVSQLPTTSSSHATHTPIPVHPYPFIPNASAIHV